MSRIPENFTKFEYKKKKKLSFLIKGKSNLKKMNFDL